MENINLNQILAEIYEADKNDELDLQLAVTLNPSISLVKSAMLETAKQVLILAVEKAEMLYGEDEGQSTTLDKESILNVIDLIK